MILSKGQILRTIGSLYVSFIASFTHAPRAWKLLIPAFRIWGIKHVGPVWFSANTTVFNGRNLVLGSRVAFGENTRLRCYETVRIGDDFLAAPGLTIDCGGHDPITLNPQGAGVTIGRRVWCGLNVTICAGVTIGDDVIIGAGAVVTKSIPLGVIAAGVPCRVIRPIGRSEKNRVWSAWN